MSRLHQVLRNGSGLGHQPDGLGAIGGADPGRDAAGSIDADLEIGPEGLPVLPYHSLDAKLLQTLGRGWNADQAAAMFGHEVDGLGCGKLRCHYQITLIFTIGIIDNDHQLASLHVGDYCLNRIKTLRHSPQPNYWPLWQTASRFIVRKSFG